MPEEIEEVKVEIEQPEAEAEAEAEAETEAEPEEPETFKLTKEDIAWIRQQRQSKNPTTNESNPPSPERIARLEVEQPPEPLIENPLADRTDKSPRRKRQPKHKRIVKVLRF